MPNTAAQLLADLYPPLDAYWPHLATVSAQQAAFLVLDQFEAGYGGAAGGGKSDALLAGAVQYADHPAYAALILRRTFADLALPGAAMSRSREWLTGKAHWADRDKTWTFPSGATLTFGYLEHEADVYRYQSTEFQYIGFDELTQFSEAQYRYLFSRLRRTTGLNVPLRMRWASNPGGVGHAWVKRTKIDHQEPGVIFIPARVADNPGLEVDEYVASLRHLDATLQAQLIDGDWGAFQGAAFTVTDDHLIDHFQLEDAHDRYEAADYGLNGAPWALVPVDYEGNLIFYDMLYAKETLPSDLAPLVLAKRKAGWGDGHYVYMDPTVWKRTGTKNKWGDPAMLADEFSDNGVVIVRANPDPRAGLIRLRELLAPDKDHLFPNWHPRAGEPGAPRVFFHRTRCEPLVEELRGAPLQPIDKPDAGEKVDPTWESQYGHACAMARYAVMAKPAPSVEPPPEIEDPRIAAMVRHEERLRDSWAPERFVR